VRPFKLVESATLSWAGERVACQSTAGEIRVCRIDANLLVIEECQRKTMPRDTGFCVREYRETLFIEQYAVPKNVQYDRYHDILDSVRGVIYWGELCSFKRMLNKPGYAVQHIFLHFLFLFFVILLLDYSKHRDHMFVQPRLFHLWKHVFSVMFILKHQMQMLMQ